MEFAAKLMTSSVSLLVGRPSLKILHFLSYIYLASCCFLTTCLYAGRPNVCLPGNTMTSEAIEAFCWAKNSFVENSPTLVYQLAPLALLIATLVLRIPSALYTFFEGKVASVMSVKPCGKNMALRIQSFEGKHRTLPFLLLITDIISSSVLVLFIAFVQVTELYPPYSKSMSCGVPSAGLTGAKTFIQSTCYLPQQLYYESVYHILQFCTLIAAVMSFVCVQCTFVVIISPRARKIVLHKQVNIDTITHTYNTMWHLII